MRCGGLRQAEGLGSGSVATAASAYDLLGTGFFFFLEPIALVSANQVSYQHRSHLFNLIHVLDLARSC